MFGIKWGEGDDQMTDDQYITTGDLEREFKALAFAMHQRFDAVEKRLDRVEKRLGAVEADLKLVRSATWDRLEEERNLAAVQGDR